MKKRINFSKSKTIVISFAVFAAIVVSLILYMPPQPGVADQNDFRRVMYFSGLSQVNKDKFRTNLFKYVVVNYNMEKTPRTRLLMLRPTTFHIYPIFVSKIICKLLRMQYFNTRVLAAVLGVLFIFSLCIIYRMILPKKINLSNITCTSNHFYIF